MFGLIMNLYIQIINEMSKEECSSPQDSYVSAGWAPYFEYKL